MSTVIRFNTNACLFNHRSKAFASKRWRHDWQHLLRYPGSPTSTTRVPHELVSFLTTSSLGIMLTTILVDFDHRSKILPNWLLVDFDHRSKILHNWWNWSYQFRVGEKGLTTILVDFDHRSKILPNWLLVDFDHRSKICSISETDLIRFMFGEKELTKITCWFWPQVQDIVRLVTCWFWPLVQDMAQSVKLILSAACLGSHEYS